MEGQITIWEYMKSLEPVQKPDDHICEGCKWRGCADRKLEVDKNGYTWVTFCPGTACANWMDGTPLNLSCQDTKGGHAYCYNRDFLPDLEHLLPLLETYYDIKFKQKVWPDGDIQWNYTYRKSTLSLSETTYMDTDKRFIAVDWANSKEGFGAPCDNLWEVLRQIDKAFMRMEGNDGRSNEHS